MKRLIGIYGLLCLGLLLGSGNIAYGQNSVLFDNANRLYNEGQTQEAIALYEQIIDQGYHSAELYYNLGNAYYKLNAIAPSIFYYEKALLLDPDDESIQNNLGFARNMTIDAIETIPEAGLSRIFNQITNRYSYDTWSYFAIALVVLSVVSFLIYYFSLSVARKRFTFVTSFAAFILSGFALALAYKQYNFDRSHNPAIIFAEETEVHADPNLRSETVFNLHEGTKVLILEEFNDDWVKIRLADGKTGWMPSSELRPLKDI